MVLFSVSFLRANSGWKIAFEGEKKKSILFFVCSGSPFVLSVACVCSKYLHVSIHKDKPANSRPVLLGANRWHGSSSGACVPHGKTGRHCGTGKVFVVIVQESNCLKADRCCVARPPLREAIVCLLISLPCQSVTSPEPLKAQITLSIYEAKRLTNKLCFWMCPNMNPQYVWRPFALFGLWLVRFLI